MSVSNGVYEHIVADNLKDNSVRPNHGLMELATELW